MLTSKNKFNVVYFILGLILLLTGIISFLNPMKSLVAIVLIFAISAIFEGIIQLAFRR